MSFKIKKQYRFKGYDYSNEGSYFITIVTKNRQSYFGDIENEQFIPSAIGKIVLENITKFIIDYSLPNPNINNHYFINNENKIIGISEYMIMPNHIHLIVDIVIVGTRLVGTRLEACSYNENQPKKIITYNNGQLHSLIPKSISSFVNHFKGKIKRQANEQQLEFDWQARFHDRIIRDDDEQIRIINYIRNNVMNWKNDNENL